MWLKNWAEMKLRWIETKFSSILTFELHNNPTIAKRKWSREKYQSDPSPAIIFQMVTHKTRSVVYK